MNKHWETIIFYLYCIHVTEKKIITENKRGKNIPYFLPTTQLWGTAEQDHAEKRTHPQVAREELLLPSVGSNVLKFRRLSFSYPISWPPGP